VAKKMGEMLGEFLGALVAWAFYVKPEIERRKEAGTLPADFQLRAFQLIFNVDADAPEVRLNDEAKVVAMVKAARDIARGQPVTVEDIAEYKELLLTEDDPDAAHITIVNIDGEPIFAADARVNATRSAAHIALARQFIDTAAWASEQGYPAVFVDNLFSASELMAKGFLIWARENQTLLKTKTHPPIKSLFNKQGQKEAIDGRYPALLNRLGQLRERARYLSGGLDLDAGEREEMLTVANEMYESFLDTSPKRATIPDDLRPTVSARGASVADSSDEST
jgi:hypothetical protein